MSAVSATYINFEQQTLRIINIELQRAAAATRTTTSMMYQQQQQYQAAATLRHHQQRAAAAAAAPASSKTTDSVSSNQHQQLCIISNELQCAAAAAEGAETSTSSKRDAHRKYIGSLFMTVVIYVVKMSRLENPKHPESPYKQIWRIKMHRTLTLTLFAFSHVTIIHCSLQEHELAMVIRYLKSVSGPGLPWIACNL